MLSRDEFGGQRLRESLVVKLSEYGVNYLAQALRSELAELSVDGHAPPDMNRGERGVGRLVNCALFVGLFVRAPVVFNARLRVHVLWRSAVDGICARVPRLALRLLLRDAYERILRRRERAGQHLQLVGLSQTEREGVAPRVPLPPAEGYEARAAREALPVVGDDALSLTPGDEPPDDDGLARAFGVARRDLEDEERRGLRPAIFPDLKAAGHAHVKLKRSLDAVAQVRDAREVRPVLVAHRQVTQEGFDRRLRSVALARHVRERKRKPACRLRAEPRDAVLRELEYGRVEREKHEMMNDECGMMNDKQVTSIHHSSFRIHHFLSCRRRPGGSA